MSPSNLQWGHSAMRDAITMASSGVKPDVLASAPMFTSSRMGWTMFSLAAAFSMAWRSSSRSTDWMRATFPTTLFTLLV